jgi:hypothetical protein
MQIKYGISTKEIIICISIDEILSILKDANALQNAIDKVKSLFGKK